MFGVFSQIKWSEKILKEIAWEKITLINLFQNGMHLSSDIS